MKLTIRTGVKVVFIDSSPFLSLAVEVDANASLLDEIASILIFGTFKTVMIKF